MSSAQRDLFRLGDFRCLGLSTVLNSVGMMGEAVVLGWLTLELTDSPFLVGVALGMRALPLFFVGVPAGVLADRFQRRRLLMLTGAGQALTTATLGAVTLWGLVSLTHVLLFTLSAGVIRAVEWAARQPGPPRFSGSPTRPCSRVWRVMSSASGRRGSAS